VIHLPTPRGTAAERAAEPHAAAQAALLERHAEGVFVISGRTVPSSDGRVQAAPGH
jgi:uncharacterized protein YciI